MKRSLLLLVAMLLTVSVVAQTEKLFNFGLEGGMNFNTFSFGGDFKDNFKSSNRMGFFVGPKMKVNVPLLGFGLDAAVLYSMNGADIQNTNTVITENLSYFEIPVNLRYSVGISAVSVYLATGPQYNVCLSSNTTLKEVYGTLSDPTRSTWGWNIGAGVELFKHLQVGVTYTIPISGTLSADNVASSLFTNYKQKTAKVRLTYYF